MSSVTSNNIVRIGQLKTIIQCTVVTTNVGVDTPVDLTNATLVQIDVKKPDGTITTLVAAVVGNPLNGVINTTDNTGIFTIRGTYLARGKVTFGDGSFFPGSWTSFSVDE